MTNEIDRTIDEIKGAVDPPQESGDLVFEAPWQARAFGLVVTLYRQGLFEWNEFQNRLIEQVQADAFADEENDSESVYYRQWIAAFEQLLADKDLFDNETIEERTLEFAHGERDASEFVVGEEGGHGHTN
jgi:nitrile hydratase accessory protein